MTDEKIEKALYTCAYSTAIHCDECPIEQEHKNDCRCGSVLAERALDYITRLKAENATLVKEADENAALAMEQKLRANNLEETVKTIRKLLDLYTDENITGEMKVTIGVIKQNIKDITEKYGVKVEE